MGIPVNEKASVSTGDAPEKKPKPQFRTIQLGIWEVVLPVSPGWNLGLLTLPTKAELFDYLSVYGLLFRLFGDIYALAPRQLILFTIFEFAQSFEGSINLYLNSQILDAVRFSSFFYVFVFSANLNQINIVKQISSHLKGEAVVRSLIVRSLASRVLVALMLNWLRKTW